jgi:hypothetical protein
MIVIYEIMGPIYIYIGSHSILSRILVIVVVLRHVLVDCLGGGCDRLEATLRGPEWGCARLGG